MSRTSPSVDRMVAVLNFIAAHPTETFTLSDLVRALTLSRATCHSLLTALVEARYLHRAGDKSYVLGPALLRIGRDADILLSPLQAAHPEMRTLADAYDVMCSAVFREGDDFIVRDRATSRSHLGWAAPRDTRLPMRPPYAAPFLAWEALADRAAWLDRLDPPPAGDERRQLADGIAAIHALGFSAVVVSPAADPETVPSSISAADAHIAFAADFPRDAAYRIRSVTAPVFGADGRALFALSIVGFSVTLPGEAIVAIGERLRAACDRVTAYVGGRKRQEREDLR